ncbi:MAG: hypothetical protein RRY95_05645 [Oscillospiraceae bacterium]
MKNTMHANHTVVAAASSFMDQARYFAGQYFYAYFYFTGKNRMIRLNRLAAC